jgi:hypothetical protein
MSNVLPNPRHTEFKDGLVSMDSGYQPAGMTVQKQFWGRY